MEIIQQWSASISDYSLRYTRWYCHQQIIKKKIPQGALRQTPAGLSTN